MEISVNGNNLQLSVDFALEIEKNNPFFSERGTQTLPITLPYSQHNLNILGNPDRIANANKISTKYIAVIREGIMQKSGRLVVFSANKEDGISCTFYLDEGEFYVLAEKTKLSELKLLSHDRTKGGSTTDEKVSRWISYIYNNAIIEENSEFSCFPVITSYEENSENPSSPNIEYLNEPLWDNTTFAPRFLVGSSPRTIGDETVPAGYGITVFLYLHYILDLIFWSFDYMYKSDGNQSGTTIFHEDNDLKRIVVLNNCADSICSGNVNYSNLVPDCTVATFIDCVEKKFGCRFIIDSTLKTVECIFFKDEAKKTYQKDLSDFVVDYPLIEHEDFKKLKLTANKVGDIGEAPYDSIAECVSNLGTIGVWSSSFPGGICVRAASGMMMRIPSNGSMKQLGMFFFDHNRTEITDITEEEEISTGDSQVPVLEGYYPEQNAGVLLQKKFFAPYVGDRIHKTTELIDKKTGEIKTESASNSDIMFCYNIGLQNNLYRMGTVTHFNSKGSAWGRLSLFFESNAGIANTFYKEYEEMLADAFRKVTVKLLMPLTEIIQLKITEPVLINGQRCLISSIKYRVSKGDKQICEAELLTMRRQSPITGFKNYVTLPKYENTGYAWVRLDNSMSVAETYKSEANPSTVATVKVKNKTTFADISIYPAPTEAQCNGTYHYYEESGYCSVEVYENGALRYVFNKVLFKSWLTAEKI